MISELCYQIPDDETVDTDFEKAVSKQEAITLRVIKKRTQEDSLLENRYPYHETNFHILPSAFRIVYLLKTMNQVCPNLVSKRDVYSGEQIAINHDREILWKAEVSNLGGPERLVMKRFIGQNEENSAREMIEEMERINQNSKNEIFKKADKDLGREGILVTVPAYEPALKTVVQPNLKYNSHPVARAMAFADLASAGLNAYTACRDGDALTREEEIEIFRSLTQEHPLTDVQKRDYREILIFRSASQIDFIEGREKAFEDEFGNLPDRAIRAVKSIMCHFDDSKYMAREIYERRKRMSFAEIVLDVGFLNDARGEHVSLRPILN